MQQAFSDDATWAEATAAVGREGTSAQSENALAVLRNHRGKHLLANESILAKQVAQLQRVIRRRAAECPTFKDLGIPAAPLTDGASYTQFIDAVASGKTRPTPTLASGQGPLAHLQAWGLWSVCPAGVIVFGRAGDRVRAWRKSANASAAATPPASLAVALVHATIVPTATASRPDQFWLTEYQRYMSVREVCRVMGVHDGNPLSHALQRVRCPTNAVSLLGRAIHAGVAKAILTLLLNMGTLSTDSLTYASACSGIDTFAAAVHDVWGDAWSYKHAAEPDAKARAVLSDAWGARARAHLHGRGRHGRSTGAACRPVRAVARVQRLLAPPARARRVGHRRRSGGRGAHHAFPTCGEGEGRRHRECRRTRRYRRYLDHARRRHRVLLEVAGARPERARERAGSPRAPLLRGHPATARAAVGVRGGNPSVAVGGERANLLSARTCPRPTGGRLS